MGTFGHFTDYTYFTCEHPHVAFPFMKLPQEYIFVIFLWFFPRSSFPRKFKQFCFSYFPLSWDILPAICFFFFLLYWKENELFIIPVFYSSHRICTNFPGKCGGPISRVILNLTWRIRIVHAITFVSDHHQPSWASHMQQTTHKKIDNRAEGLPATKSHYWCIVETE